MMPSRNVLLLIGLIALTTFATAFAQSLGDLRVALPDRTMKVSRSVELDELRNSLELDLSIASVLESRDPRMYLDVRLSEPSLYSKLLAAFTSREDDGCSRIYREAQKKGALEAELCQLQKLSVGFDRKKGSGSLRARARMRIGTERKPSDHAVVLETSILFKNGSIVLRPTALDVEGLPRDARELLLEKFDEQSFFVHRCLEGASIEIEDFTLPEGKNEVTIRASSPISDSFRMLGCLGREGVMDLQLPSF